MSQQPDQQQPDADEPAVYTPPGYVAPALPPRFPPPPPQPQAAQSAPSQASSSQPPQPGYDQPAYGQPPLGQSPQPGYGQPAYGQPPFGQTPYSQGQYSQGPYGATPYNQGPYGAPQAGQFGATGFAGPTQYMGGTGYIDSSSGPRGLSLASMIIGLVSLFIVGWFVIPQIVGIVLGHLGLSKESPQGKPFSITGLITNYLSLLIYLGIYAFFIYLAAMYGETSPDNPLSYP